MIKKINENKKDHKTFFDNYEKNKIRKKMILKIIEIIRIFA